MLFISRVRQSLQITTPFVNAAIEGTQFVIEILDDRAVISVFEGAVRATTTTTTPETEITVRAGQAAQAVKGQPPVLIQIRPRDAVQWAIYYEPVLPVESLETLDKVDVANRDANYHLRRANTLLAAGQLVPAREAIASGLKLNPDLGDAYVLQAVIAVALNDRDEALTNAREAVAKSPKSASAQIALSVRAPVALRSRWRARCRGAGDYLGPKKRNGHGKTRRTALDAGRH